MQGISPISKSKDRICLLTPNPMQQLTSVCVICDIIFIPFAIMMCMANKEMLAFMLVLGLFAFVVTFICFGFSSKYVFDTVKKQLLIEGTRFCVPYRDYLCDFSDINIIGVQCYEHHSKHRTDYSYDLVFAAKQLPDKFIKLASSMGIKYALDFDEINKLGLILSETIGCRFMSGEPERSIQAFPSGGSVKYAMGNAISSFLG